MRYGLCTDFIPILRSRIHRGSGRPLHARIKEYLDGKEKLRASTALGYHRIHCLEGEDFGVKVEILGREVQTFARKAPEAFWTCSQIP